MFKDSEEGVLISLFVLPNAPKSQIIGPYNQSLKIKINSPPVDGKANTQIEEYFAEIFQVAKNKVAVVRGDKSKNKTLLVRGVSAAQASAVLSRLWK